jgi:hypothetical protein
MHSTIPPRPSNPPRDLGIFALGFALAATVTVAVGCARLDSAMTVLGCWQAAAALVALVCMVVLALLRAGRSDQDDMGVGDARHHG